MKTLIITSDYYEGRQVEAAFLVPDEFDFVSDRTCFWRELSEAGTIKLTKAGLPYSQHVKRATERHLKSIAQRHSQPPTTEICVDLYGAIIDISPTPQ